ncbi:MAG: bifunctional phosphopantothenoylcysteine decarboxylase/phosphopantothenate--cysteine ligase CoaBC [Actinomycetaceae bacterium]|nr:bifunctional phosphopantothenoylcysteine decarboxylase/phosphopantothenate--cysteine ligase CoaBC [Actinomycetaceae bacterium]
MTRRHQSESTQRIVLGVGAGIAAYKIPYLARRLMKDGYDVRVIPTPSSCQFVGLSTWSALTGYATYTGVFDGDLGVDHVEIARTADLIVIAPATADLLARLRIGIADDLLTTTVLAASCPVMVVPAMHTAMWEDPATQDNITALRNRGIIVMEPVEGDLSSGDTGAGRMPEPEDIAQRATLLLEETPVAQSLAGFRAFVTAGGTHEPIDPVRFIGNRSSGRQGCAVAAALQQAGAEVTLFAANIDPAIIPSGMTVIQTPTAQQMYDAVTESAHAYDIGVFVAAVADFRPRHRVDRKIKKESSNMEGLTLELKRNPDILATVAKSNPELFCVGFAAETGSATEVLEAGRDKARRKGAALIAINSVGENHGFGNVDNQLDIVDSAGNLVDSYQGSKRLTALGLIATIAKVFPRQSC